MEGEVFEAYKYCTELKSLLNMKSTNRHMLRWQIGMQEYGGNMTIIHKEVKGHTYEDSLSRCPLDNVKINPAYDPEIAVKVCINFMEIDRRRNFRFSEWAPENSTPDNHLSGPEGTGTPMFGKHSSELHTEVLN
ncbi:hypothetical protein O181_006982 [Austropuccinia psidii MF-1]|uniref:Uncharacterized protein n=1 Tax=Austropuccinia psidii MF-1 TaxID=1389203 RepID=A0A9Q3BLU4_9BASI|nr:hypothetical protein [Austropuccinia psidii MF-1]